MGSYHLPFLYSCVSFLGVLLLLVCTPLGFIRLFGVVGQVLVKPTTRDVNEEYHASYLEEASVLRKLENLQYNQTMSTSSSSSASLLSTTKISNAPIHMNKQSSSKYCDINAIPKAFGSIAHSILRHRQSYKNFNRMNHMRNHEEQFDGSNGTSALTISNEFYNNAECDGLYERLRELKSERKELDKLRKSTGIQRNLIYPLAMLMLLFLTGITVLIVVQNALELLIGIKALPLSTRVNVASY